MAMGFLIYGGTHEYEFDDRTLGHLKVAITTKLRRQEHFLLNWVTPADRGGGRLSLWLAPSIPLVFKFSGSQPLALNTVWLAALNDLSNTPRGLDLISEDEAQQHMESR